MKTLEIIMHLMIAILSTALIGAVLYFVINMGRVLYYEIKNVLEK